MLKDRYGLPLSTGSVIARDAYVEGLDLLLTQYPGITGAFDRAIAADPGFAAAHIGRAQGMLLGADMPGAREAVAAAEALAGGITAREASQIGFFRLLLAARVAPAIAALRVHMAEWPRDALVLNTTANPNGLIGSSGEVGQKAALLALMNGLAPHYGDDWWFASAHAMAFSEAGQRDAARPRIEHSLSLRPDSAWVAHSQAHLFYEDGNPRAAGDFLRDWLRSYPSGGVLHGHLHWHQALCELEAGDPMEAFRLYRETCSLEGHSGQARQKMQDAASFLWRWELAGHPRDDAAWHALHAFAVNSFPKASVAFADLHVVLAQSVAGDGDALEARIGQMAELEQEGRYPSGPVVPALTRAFLAFQRREFSTAINLLEPLLAQSERIGGSRAQTDLVEFTLLKACVEAGRLEDAQSRFVIMVIKHADKRVTVCAFGYKIIEEAAAGSFQSCA